MSDRNTRRGQFGPRLALYGAAVLIVGGIAALPNAWKAKVDVETQLGDVFAASATGDWAGAKRRLDLVAAEYPDHFRVELTRGWLHEVAQDFPAAQAVYRSLLPRCRSDEQARDLSLSIADLQRRQGRREDAERALQENEKSFGASSRSRHLRILLRVDAGDLSGALSEARIWAEEGRGDSKAQRLVQTIATLIEANSKGEAMVEAACIASCDAEPKAEEATTSRPTEAKVQGDPNR